MSSRDDARSSPRVRMTAPDTVRILAAMVQFQQDTDERTSGDGKFLLVSATDPVVDAPPHDRAYFENHLRAAEHY